MGRAGGLGLISAPVTSSHCPQEGRREGLLSGIEVALDVKFGADGLALMPQIAAIDDVVQLQTIQSALRTAATVDDVRRLIA